MTDKVWEALCRLRMKAAPERRLLHKNQQYAYGYGASPRQLHEMAKAWSWAGPVIEASRFVHAYGGRPTKFAERATVQNMLVQAKEAEIAFASAHDKMLAAGWTWDGMDGYAAPGLDQVPVGQAFKMPLRDWELKLLGEFGVTETGRYRK